MHFLRKYLLVLFAGGFVSLLNAAILSPEQRLEKIEFSKELVDLKPALISKEDVEEIGNPFSRSRLVVEVEEVKAVVVKLDDESILEGVSRSLVPDGVFQVNGVYFALFDGLRVKQGDSVVRKYMDREYTVVFDELDNTAFAIRYGEARLQIKLK